MKCPKCGLEINENNKFCQGCGTPLQQTPAAAPSPTEIQQQPKKAWYKRWWVWLIIGLSVIMLLLGGTCTACTCALLSQPVTEPTQKTEENQSSAFTSYYTDSKREFHDISYEYNSHWNESESTLKNGYEYHIDNPKISLAVYALTYSSEQEVETLIEEYRKTKDSGKLIDEKTYDFENTPTVIHRFMRTNTGEDKSVQYNDIATLAYLGYYYTFIVKSDYDNRDQCEDIMEQTIYSIKLYEEETTAPPTVAPTTKKATEPATEKKTEKPTEPPTEKPQIVNHSSANGFWAEGNGDYVAEGLKITDCAILYFDYSGEHNFIVTLYKGDERVSGVVNEIGSYTGSVLVSGSGEYSLQIKSSGNWSIKSSGLSIDDSTSFSGHGDSVTGITSHGGGNWHFTHNGEHNFIVTAYRPNGERERGIVNEIGNYDGVVKAPTGNICFSVKADGDWTIEKQ